MKELFTLASFLFIIGLTGCESVICDNTCPFNNDGVCDDGGEGAAYDVCQYGSDCADCGERAAP